MTALEFMGWEIPENWEDAGSYFEKEDGSTGFIKAIPLKTWKHGQWVVPDKDYSGHSYLLEDPMLPGGRSRSFPLLRLCATAI